MDAVLDQESDGKRRETVQDVAPLVSLPARLEAILYLKGRPVSLQELSELVGLSESDTEQGMPEKKKSAVFLKFTGFEIYGCALGILALQIFHPG